MRLLVLSLAFLLAGCSSLPTAPDDARPTKDLNVTCIAHDTLPSDSTIFRVNVDKGVLENGELDAKCGAHTVKVTNSKAKP